MLRIAANSAFKAAGSIPKQNSMLGSRTYRVRQKIKPLNPHINQSTQISPRNIFVRPLCDRSDKKLLSHEIVPTSSFTKLSTSIIDPDAVKAVEEAIKKTPPLLPKLSVSCHFINSDISKNKVHHPNVSLYNKLQKDHAKNMQAMGFNHVPFSLSERIKEHPKDITHAIILIQGNPKLKKYFGAWRAMMFACFNEEDIKNLHTESMQFSLQTHENNETLDKFRRFLLNEIKVTKKPVIIISMEDAAFFDPKIIQPPLYKQFMLQCIKETFIHLGLFDNSPEFSLVVTTTQAQRAPIGFTHHLGKDFGQAENLGHLIYPYYRVENENGDPVNINPIMEKIANDYGKEAAMDLNTLKTYLPPNNVLKHAGNLDQIVWDNKLTLSILNNLKHHIV